MINRDFWLLGGTAVSLGEVLAFRDRRSLRRRRLLDEFNAPLVCLSLNIPGEYKNFPLALRCFHEEQQIFILALRAEDIEIIHEESEEEKSGYTAFISVAAAADRIKGIALRLEDTHSLGRLFDIDVFEPGGKKLSRKDFGEMGRSCLVCGGDSFVCAHSRTHDIKKVIHVVLGTMENFLKEKLGQRIMTAALKALLDEVAVTPKPGLVDRANNGAHRDMDFFTFIDSTAAILPFFRDCALAGFDHAGTPEEIFDRLRPEGKRAEVLMRDASGGVNTQRGIVFSIGLLSAAYGRLHRDEDKPNLDTIFELSRNMTRFIMNDFSHSPGSASHGEAIYKQSGIRGIRGEAFQGFPAVKNHSLPLLRRMLDQGYSVNDAGLVAFLSLLAYTEDTNIVYRSDLSTLDRIQKSALLFLEADPDMEALREWFTVLDRDFITQNISPGGSADLLAVTFFLYWLFK
jgi:holo-ACP synthase/triphosphoribosyl-dephospho-CoA synthase